MMIKKIWNWLGNEKNNRALGSIIFITALVSFAYLSGIFGFINIIQFDDKIGVVLSNTTNKDIYISNIETVSRIDGWSLVTTFADTIPTKSIKLLKAPDLIDYKNELGGFYLNKNEITNSILENSYGFLKSECYIRTIFSKNHPAFIQLAKNPQLYTFDVTTTLNYKKGSKFNELNFDSIGVIFKKENCKET